MVAGLVRMALFAERQRTSLKRADVTVKGACVCVYVCLTGATGRRTDPSSRQCLIRTGTPWPRSCGVPRRICATSLAWSLCSWGRYPTARARCPVRRPAFPPRALLLHAHPPRRLARPPAAKAWVVLSTLHEVQWAADIQDWRDDLPRLGLLRVVLALVLMAGGKLAERTWTVRWAHRPALAKAWVGGSRAVAATERPGPGALQAYGGRHR
jgi:hypothetical protein